MKKQISFMALFMLTVAVLLTSCSNSKTNDDVTPQNTNSTSLSGTWKVSQFIDSGKDETYKFNGYTFAFDNDGSIVSTNGSNTITGTWSMGTDDSQTKLFISFGATQPHDELSDDWAILEKNNSIIRLQDVSGGNGGTDQLAFEK